MSAESKNKAAILLSRQPLRPCRSTPWVRAAGRAVQRLKEANTRLYTSVGIQTYELLIYLALKENIPQEIILAAVNSAAFERVREQTREQFRIADPAVTFTHVSAPNVKASAKAPVMRDRYIISNADLLFPIAVRAGGNMDRLIAQKEAEGGQVNREFQIVHQKRHTSMAYQLDQEALSTQLLEFDKPCLIHWTRSFNGPWPFEKRIDYYRAISQADRHPRSAYDTLLNILKQKRIYGSSRHKTGKIVSVSFSSLAPRDMLPLMRWRARYKQMYFEPYGIGIDAETGTRCGICPVHYYRGQKAPTDIDSWLLQSVGSKGDWFREKEFRFLGHFNLRRVSWDQLICFCRTQAEAAHIQHKFQIKAIGFLDAPNA